MLHCKILGNIKVIDKLMPLSMYVFGSWSFIILLKRKMCCMLKLSPGGMPTWQDENKKADDCKHMWVGLFFSKK